MGGVVNGRASALSNIHSLVPQGSISGSVLWNVYVDDRIRQLIAVKALCRSPAARRTMAPPPREQADAGGGGGGVGEWGTAWPVHFALIKTHALILSRSVPASRAVAGKLRFRACCLPLQDNVKILEIMTDRELRFIYLLLFFFQKRKQQGHKKITKKEKKNYSLLL